MATLLLFDLDGTLVHIPSSLRAFAGAFRRVCGLDDATRGVAFAGRTDPALFAEVIARRGLHGVTVADLVPAYLDLLAEELARDPGRVLPGVRELLDALARWPGVCLALGTGNVEAGARLKLGAHGLNPYFPTGGFGDDGPEREAVIRTGIARASRYYGCAFDRVVVIGDTPLDVAAAQANGALTLAVATGRYSASDLAACGATVVLPDFADVPRALATLAALAAGAARMGA